MDLLIQTIAENGIAVGSFIGLLYYIFYDKKQTYSYMTDMSNTQKEMVKSLNDNANALKQNTETLEKLNDRVENIEEKLKRSED